MNPKLLLLLISFAAFSSCNTIYKTGQTPDDVYYSPARSYGEADENNDKARDEGVDKYQGYNDDRAIRMGINDARWRYLDNDYGYNQYYSPYNQYYNNYSLGFSHGYYYNPYFWPYPVYSVYSPVYSPVFVAPSNPKITTPRLTNLGAYGAIRGYNNAPLSPKSSRNSSVRNYNNNNGSAVGNAIRRVLSPDNSGSSYYTPNNNNNNNRTYTPSNSNNNNTRSYTPSSSSSSSGSSSSGSSGGGISRPARSGSR